MATGVPLFLVLHVGFAYYFMCQQSDSPEKHAVKRESCDSTAHSRNRGEWIVLLVLLVALRVAAVYLVLDLPLRLHALASDSPSSDTLTYFVLTPLAVVLVDHSANVRLACDGNLNESWMNLIQSTLSTYFFFRPLAALAGHDVDPAGGRVGLGTCLLLSAFWLSISSIPRKSYATTGERALS